MKFTKTLLVVSLGLAGLSEIALAAPAVNPPNVPLESSDANSLVKPNIMYVFDDSIHMSKSYMGDELALNNCKSVVGSRVEHFTVPCFIAPTSSANGDLLDKQYALDGPMSTVQLNKLTYNPSTTYSPGVTSTGSAYPAQVITAATNEPYIADPTKLNRNLTSSGSSGFLRDIYYCNTATPTDLATQCKRNGVDTPGGLGANFDYVADGFPNTTYKHRVNGPVIDGIKVLRPTYFKMTPFEYCDNNMVNCSSDSTAYVNAAYIRWCKSATYATDNRVVTGRTGGDNKCQKNYNASSGYIYPRYAKFARFQIASTEYTNYANWFSYHRTRFLALKTASGYAFKDVSGGKRVGFITINPDHPVSSSKFLAIDDFVAAHKSNFYAKLYSQTIKTSGGSALREALSRVGRYYGGKIDGINTNMGNDPVQYSCQPNFALVANQGYWDNTSQASIASGQTLDGSAIGNQDNTNAGFSTRSSGSYDGGLSSATGTLADVAMYYYKTDLRTAGSTSGVTNEDVGTNNVPISVNNSNTQQHMVTYAVSAGMSGFLSYTGDYSSGKNIDLENIKSGASGVCSWTVGVCDWPAPVAGTASTIDDLWHATINGRGKFYNAQNGSDMVNGLQNALTSLVSKTASSAAAATSSPNVTSGDNFLYYTTYRTVSWDGEISAKTINPISGTISTSELWSARGLLNTKSATDSDTRNVYFVRNAAGNNALTTFKGTGMNASEMGYFKNKCSDGGLNCSGMDVAMRAIIDNGHELVDYLRGYRGFEQQNNFAFPLFRDRSFILGDIVNASPVYVGPPMQKWTDATYTTFKTANATRTPVIYAGANDGMLHAFNASTGDELFAVIPGIHMPNLHKLADRNYGANHRFYVDGTIAVMDAKIGTTYKTVLVTGMGAGGKGYMALDITNPTSPQLLWEFCNNSTLCADSDSELGLTYGNPIITKRHFDGASVVYVAAGYDNSTGKGLIYELDVGTGAILRRLYSGTGSAASQAGISEINTYHDDPTTNTAKYLYAGDLDGNIWKWDLTSNNTTAILIGSTKDASGNAQPITTKIEIGKMNGKPVLFVGTGKYLNLDDASSTSVQSIYAIKDNETGSTYGNLRNHADIVAQTITPASTTSSITNNAVDWTSKIGWYFDLTSQVGERVNVDMSLVLGTLNIVTNVPASSICTAGGNSWYYQVNYRNGGAVDGNSGILAKKIFGGLAVGQVIVRLGASGVLKNYITDAGGSVTPYGMTVGSSSGATSTAVKTGWKEIHKQ